MAFVDDDLEMYMQLNGIVNMEIVNFIDDNEPRRILKQEDPFVELSDRKFIGTYRLSKQLVEELIDTLTPYMNSPMTSSGITIKRKVLTALRFFASGSYQQDIGEHRGAALSQPSVSRCITEVAEALNNPIILNKYIHFPSTIEQLNIIRQGFYNKFGIPGVIGVIDGTHVAIVPPNTADDVYPEHIYVNRKGYHSINTQLICDSDLMILNVCAKFPGSTHDSHIWRLSPVEGLMKQLHAIGQTSYFLLGDSGYPLRQWLLTPLYQPQPNTPEANYNKWFCRTRSIIERCNGVLKMRFRCLLKHRVLHYSLEKAASIINSCTILHNISISNNIPIIRNIEDLTDIDLGNIDNDPEVEQIVNRINPELTAGKRMQQTIIDLYFQ
ncbi:putative nuclease HARBI1 [Myzus persicae]|uniref:putative nuclease HARBI1 n=1 Tax=Myzus persicae TaxID=13164 RepID=UPI000B93589D|nr:putative nuclease HARBI1 [Myzus persicae]